MTGPKGSTYPNTVIADAPIVLGTGVKAAPGGLPRVVPATAASVSVGIAEDDQDTIGRTVPIASEPGAKVRGRSGAAFAIDALLTTNAAGKLVAATSGQPVIAISRQAATAADQLVTVQVMPGNTPAP